MLSYPNNHPAFSAAVILNTRLYLPIINMDGCVHAYYSVIVTAESIERFIMFLV